MQPIILHFDGRDNVDGSSIVRFPKLNYGAPYKFGLRVRMEDESYREWTAENIRWKIKLRPADKAELLVLEKYFGNFEVHGDTLEFVIKADDWIDVQVPQSANVLEMDVPFAYVVEFLDIGGAIIERFCHGSGFITVNMDF
jgi:hypothetical protein